MSNNLSELRQKKDWTQQDAADAMGVSKGQYIKLENGERRLTLDYIVMAAKAFNVPVSAIFVDQTVRVVGYVGAGAQATLYSEGQQSDDVAPAPSNATETTVAVEIRGSSLGSMFDKWFAYYDDVRTPPTTDILRKLCVVGLRDGRVLIKKIIPGSQAGHFHLESQTEGIIENALIDWAAEVTALLPKS